MFFRWNNETGLSTQRSTLSSENTKVEGASLSRTSVRYIRNNSNVSK